MHFLSTDEMNVIVGGFCVCGIGYGYYTYKHTYSGQRSVETCMRHCCSQLHGMHTPMSWAFYYKKSEHNNEDPYLSGLCENDLTSDKDWIGAAQMSRNTLYS